MQLATIKISNFSVPSSFEPGDREFECGNPELTSFMRLNRQTTWAHLPPSSDWGSLKAQATPKLSKDGLKCSDDIP